MKITIEDTTDFHDNQMPKITYELPFDDLSLDDMFEAFKAISLARGFSEKSIDEYLCAEP
ncbi:MAG: hypothetical protein KDC67_14240 [Ignavibacteriae bacterium]|nr:hypothetical protein [Ignavibacteriota bacterium]